MQKKYFTHGERTESHCFKDIVDQIRCKRHITQCAPES